jgi:prepilin-type N-terminal cleavage/methylation domain-containing protein
MARRGFTLIEMLTVIGVLMALTSLLVLYNRSGERQLVLLREKVRFINAFMRAKNLALSTVIENEPACGYGLHIEPDAYFIYRDRAVNCRTSDRIYGASADEEVSGTRVVLPAGFRIAENGVRDIMLVPPNPVVFLDGGSGITEGKVVITSPDPDMRVSLTITNAGQISE